MKNQGEAISFLGTVNFNNRAIQIIINTIIIIPWGYF